MRFVLIIFLLFNLNVFCQKEVFKGKGLYRSYMLSKNDSVVTEQAIGKDVKIIHDKFFNSWEITYAEEDGSVVRKKFTYIQGGPNLEMEVYKDDFDKKYFFLNDISKSGSLIFAPDEEPKNGMYRNFSITDVRPMAVKK